MRPLGADIGTERAHAFEKDGRQGARDFHGDHLARRLQHQIDLRPGMGALERGAEPTAAAVEDLFDAITFPRIPTNRVTEQNLDVALNAGAREILIPLAGRRIGAAQETFRK